MIRRMDTDGSQMAELDEFELFFAEIPIISKYHPKPANPCSRGLNVKPVDKVTFSDPVEI